MAHFLIVSFTFDPATDLQYTEEVVRAIGQRPSNSTVREGERDLEFRFDNEYSLEKAMHYVVPNVLEAVDQVHQRPDLYLGNLMTPLFRYGLGMYPHFVGRCLQCSPLVSVRGN